MGLKKRLVLAWQVLVLPPAQLRSLFARELGAMTRFKRLHGPIAPKAPKGNRVILFEEQSIPRGED